MKPVVRLLAGIALVVGLSSLSAFAQSVISAKSGVLHYTEGRVLLGDQLVESGPASFPDIKENTQLRTEDGRAEVLLTPGVILRVGESSAIRMITNRLIDTRVEFVSGSAIVEAADLPKDNAVTMVYNDYTVRILKKGLYRFDTEPAQLRVYDGEAQVESAGKTVAVNEGRKLAFAQEMTVAKFDTKDGDSLYRWAKRRGEYFAVANVSAARSVRESGNSWMSSGWVYNPYFSMFTYIPMNGMYYSPFGYAFWSPFTVYRAYYYLPTAPMGGYRSGTIPNTATTRPITPGAVANSGRTGGGSVASVSRSSGGFSGGGAAVSRSGGFGGGGGGVSSGAGTPRGR